MGGMLFTNEADVQLLLSCLQSAAHSQEMLQILKSSQEPEPKANVGGNLTVAVVNAQDGQQSFWVSIDDGNRKHVGTVGVARQNQSAQPRKRGKVANDWSGHPFWISENLLPSLLSIAHWRVSEREGVFSVIREAIPANSTFPRTDRQKPQFYGNKLSWTSELCQVIWQPSQARQSRSGARRL
jgi:hypothetical protein